MIFKILLKYILGYVNISVQGYYIERFINICISKGIFLWNVRIEKSTYARANIGIKDFKRIKEVARKTQCRISLNTKKGLPFILDRYKKRKIFLVVLIAVLGFMYVESKFVWNIEIQGIERIAKEEIQVELEENGLKVGAKKSSVKPKEIINNIRLKRNDIAWMNIDLTRNKRNSTNSRNN